MLDEFETPATEALNGLADIPAATNILTGYGAFDWDCTKGFGYFLTPYLDGEMRFEPQAKSGLSTRGG
jgi:hypothetical protein